MFEQLKDWLRGDRSAPRNILGDLIADYRTEIQAAAQLRVHAEQVPYPQAAATLHRMAEAADRHARLLREQIATLGGSAPEVSPAIYEGMNHWDRMAANLRTADERRRRYLEQAIRWDIEYPEVTEVLSGIAADETVNRRRLEELVTRADSLALD
jgi:rubrerythrin